MMGTKRLGVRALSVSWGEGNVEGRGEGQIRGDIGVCRLPVLLLHSHVTFAGGY